MFKKKSQRELDDALLGAIGQHKFDRALKLLEKGAQVDACDAQGNGVLHALTGALKYQGRWDISSFLAELMRRGADINATNNKGQTCLHVLAQVAHNRESYHADMLDAILDFGFKSSRRCEDLELLTMLRAYNARLDIQDADGRLPAHVCAARNDLEMTQACLPDAALFAVRDRDGMRPVDLVRPGSWVLLKPDQVAHVSVEAVIGYKLTEVFNFTSRTYTRITHNLETKVDATETRGFDDFADKTAFTIARDELQRLGGHVDKSTVTGIKPLDKPKF